MWKSKRVSQGIAATTRFPPDRAVTSSGGSPRLYWVVRAIVMGMLVACDSVIQAQIEGNDDKKRIGLLAVFLPLVLWWRCTG